MSNYNKRHQSVISRDSNTNSNEDWVSNIENVFKRDAVQSKTIDN